MKKKNNNKITNLSILGLFVILLAIISLMSFVIVNEKNKKTETNDNNTIPNNYIAVFHGGAGEITYETYIYKIDNGHANSGFEYINVTSTTKSWGSSEWNSKITGKGKVQWTDDVFPVAKENGAYSYVTIPNDNNTYSIEEFMNRFIMD